MVRALSDEFTERHETMQTVLQYLDDPANAFRLRMPELFISAKASIDELSELSRSVKGKYASLLSKFKATGIKSSDWCLLWDDFFIPGDLIANKPEKVQKGVLLPMFCQGHRIGLDELMVLWGMRPMESLTAKKPAPKRNAKNLANAARKSMMARKSIRSMTHNRRRLTSKGSDIAPGSRRSSRV